MLDKWGFYTATEKIQCICLFFDDFQAPEQAALFSENNDTFRGRMMLGYLHNCLSNVAKVIICSPMFLFNRLPTTMFDVFENIFVSK